MRYVRCTNIPTTLKEKREYFGSKLTFIHILNFFVLIVQSNIAAKRLSVFKALSQGTSLCDDRSLPHILKSSEYYNQNQTNKHKVVVANYAHQQERCWKSLLLQQSTGNNCNSSSFAGTGSLNEWEIVRDHFENSRSKKVLSIIQQ